MTSRGNSMRWRQCTTFISPRCPKRRWRVCTLLLHPKKKHTSIFLEDSVLQQTIVFRFLFFSWGEDEAPWVCFPPEIVESDDEYGYTYSYSGLFGRVSFRHFKNHLRHPRFNGWNLQNHLQSEPHLNQNPSFFSVGVVSAIHFAGRTDCVDWGEPRGS